MKRVAVVALALSACTTDIGPPAQPGDVVDERCANGGVAVGFPLRPASYTVGQGNDGAFSHSGLNQFAFDFTLDVGTDVIAARGGTVVYVVDGFGEGGPSIDKAHEANVIVVDHGGGTFDSYFHLEAGSLDVSVGDVVGTGDLLARSGNSGYTSGPHLHFAVVDATMQSLPACFQPGDLVPASDSTVEAVASPAQDFASYPRSFIARGAFAANNVLLDTDLVAFGLEGTVHIEGHITDDKGSAVAFIGTPGEPTVIKNVTATADASGAFVIDLDTAGTAGIRQFGVTSAVADQNFNAPATAPVIIK